MKRLYFEARHIDTLDFVALYRDAFSIEGGILREDCAQLYGRPWDVRPEAKIANL